jgi:hypothetical protein
MTTETCAKPKPGGRSILLGLFVLCQLIFLPLANVMQLVPREMPVQKGEFDIRVQRDGTATNVRPIQDAINALGTAIDRYGEASGQVQAWSLFAPEFATQSVFPSVECVGLDRRVTIEPKHLPRDPAHYVRWPGPLSRLDSYDYLLAVVYAGYTEPSVAERGNEWRDAVRQRVRDQQRSLESYFRFNLKLFRELHPDRPTPREMILNVIVMPSPPPGQTERPASMTVPLARWVPDQPPAPGYLPIQAYDPVAKQFVRLPIDEGAP